MAVWSWDQGRLDYFQFDELRKMAKFVVAHDVKAADVASVSAAIGLPFKPATDPLYKPWRNYGRVFKAAFLVSERGKIAEPTPIAKLLAQDGQVNSDEYFHFLAEATTDPSPARRDWDALANHRYPLLFSLRFILARAAVGINTTTLDQIIGAYNETTLTGDEGDEDFLGIINQARSPAPDSRQAKESLRVLSQLSYLNLGQASITVSLDKDDASQIFQELAPVTVPRQPDPNEEIRSIAKLFVAARDELDFEYSNTVLSDTFQAGFEEGGRVERIHLKIERNAQLRRAFFNQNPSAVCDFCGDDTKKSYPWSERILDIHHVLPLCSGARTSKSGTVLDDLVANCPTCHRAVHRFYGNWLKKNEKKDFTDAAEAKAVYRAAKSEYRGATNA
ncbi:HNH endonuclease signature motif containing protein [Rhizobium leguminosarum]|uniref:HNH endonuclease signature motif containing protein n=1 Tax=Rhizobium leguminosarum TaxID=384 RepID=UPI003F9BDE27